MKEAIVAKGPKVSIHDVPVPKPNADQVLIKVIYSGSNPKDWKIPESGDPQNSGDDIAGIVEAVGENVTEFKKGDRVAAFHEMFTPGGSFAEYAIAWDHTTFHLPKKISFEEVSGYPYQCKFGVKVKLMENLGRYNSTCSNDLCYRHVLAPWSSGTLGCNDYSYPFNSLWCIWRGCTYRWLEDTQSPWLILHTGSLCGQARPSVEYPPNHCCRRKRSELC